MPVLFWIHLCFCFNYTLSNVKIRTLASLQMHYYNYYYVHVASVKGRCMLPFPINYASLPFTLSTDLKFILNILCNWLLFLISHLKNQLCMQSPFMNIYITYLCYSLKQGARSGINVTSLALLLTLDAHAQRGLQ